MKLSLLIILLLFSSCRSSKSVETTTKEIDTTYWHSDTSLLTLSDIQEKINWTITITDLKRDSSGEVIESPSKRLDIIGVNETAVKEQAQGNSVQVVSQSKEVTQEQTPKQPEHPPACWGWVVVVALIVLIFLIRR
jgi:hypothetical protein